MVILKIAIFSSQLYLAVFFLKRQILRICLNRNKNVSQIRFDNL